MKPKRVIIKSPDLDVNRVFTNESKMLKFLRSIKKLYGGTDYGIKRVNGKWQRYVEGGGNLKISISPCAS